jgi:hypothetical protein
VKPAPKRTDDAVRPAPKPARQGPKVVPRSVPTAVEDAEPEGDGAEIVDEDSPAERRA